MESNRMEKHKRHWSAMDTVILLLIVVAVVGLVYRVVYAARRDNSAESVMYRVYFEVLETHEDVLAEVRGFDAIYLLENDVCLGYVGVYEDTATGEYTVALTQTPASGPTGDDRVTASGCMICTNALPNQGGGLRVGNSGRVLAPGSMLEVRTDRVLMTIRITAIREHT